MRARFLRFLCLLDCKFPCLPGHLWGAPAHPACRCGPAHVRWGFHAAQRHRATEVWSGLFCAFHTASYLRSSVIP